MVAGLEVMVYAATMARSTAGTATPILLIIACVAGGAMLLRGPQAVPLEEQS